MNIPYFHNMTEPMKDIAVDTLGREVAEKEFVFCHENYIVARNLERSIKLPMTNEEGIPITHGTRLIIDRVVSYWKGRMDLIAPYVDDEFAWSIVKDDK